MVYLLHMEIQDTPIVQSQKKFSLARVGAEIFKGALFIVVGYCIGVTSIGGNAKSVLGVQSSSSIANRLALLFNYSIEKPSQVNTTIQLAPLGSSEDEVVPTEEPTPTPEAEDDTPDIFWGGTSRNPKPTPTPAPNNYITVPEPTVDENAPTPTPQYRYGGGRNATPTPTPNKMKVETAEEATVTGFTKTPSKTSIIPTDVQEIIDGSGLQINDLEVIRSEKEEGVRVAGRLRETLFGFLTVGYPVSFKVDQDMGSIDTASIPWWRSLFGNPFVGKISQIRCGDGICSSTESITTCADDCTKVCGNGICEFGEGVDTCQVDCEFNQ